mgnify:CR=1 FL=1
MTSWSTFFRRFREARGAYPDKSGAGIRTDHWFWASAKKIASSVDSSQPVDAEDNTAGLKPSTDSAEQEVNDIILQSPQISGAALVNAMKAKGLKVVKATESKKHFFAAQVEHIKASRRSREADSSTANAAVLVAREARFKFNSGRLREAASDDGIGPTRFKVVLLQEGLGNLRDAYYYSRQALESAIPIFTGSKIYADHPSAVEEEIRPERSVRDVLGHFENISVEESNDGTGQLVGELVILPDKPFEWARALVRHAIEHAKKFPEKEFVGLSINASGDASPVPIEEALKSAPEGAKPKLIEAQQSGVESVRMVSTIKSAVSCDLVTEAGAGGKILNLIERK